MLPASLEAVSRRRPGGAMLSPRLFSLPLPLSTRCLILKAHASSLNCLEPPEEDEQMKASALFGAGWENDSVEVLWQDAGRAFCRLGRDGPAGDTHAFIPVLSGSEHPTLESINRLIREYELKDDLAADWALRPVELVRERGRTMLVVDYVGGEPLDHLVGEPMEVGGFLRLAVALSGALSQLHGRGLIHKDIKPANVVVDSATSRVRLTGFGIASRLPRERQSPAPPEFIAGTLAYMAPEQTGRVNRSIDSRSDLYSLGVTFYEMLTGSLPFTASDPMEWVHCHISREPVPPSERVQHVPATLSTITMKLLAKTAEERYQTAAGLERDLRRCLAQFEAEGRIDDFPLGEHDTPDRLLIPEKLYGRAREIEILLAAFNRIVKGGATELVLVSGYSGIGKSSVVNELHRVLVAPRGLFAAGKFDQYKRDIPYSTLAQAFQDLVRPLLGKSEGELARWRDALREALGPNGQLMIDLVPELKLIIGEQAPVPELPPQDAQRRFQLVFRRFLSVFARPEHPLALFLDDLQWLDAATLDLIDDVLTQPDMRHLLLIGAYRDNEVTATHPLIRTLDAIRKAGAPVQDIVLAPLTREDVGLLTADSLYCDRERAASLAQLVLEKTDGNPFFVIQFLSAMVEEGLLTFDHDVGSWFWDLTRIHARAYTDNVIDLMVGKLSRLPTNTQEALQQLACLGNSAEFAVLAMVRQDSKEQLDRDLEEALRAGLVLPAEGSCRFLHDRVQEAAYSQIPEAQRAEAHLRIGKLLVAHTPREKREEAIFEIVNQLDRAAVLISSRAEKEQLAEFNLIAGKRAKASTAYVSALKYLVAGTSLLSDDGWECQPDLIFALELHRAECEFLTGELAAAEARLTMLSSSAANPVDQATVACLRIDLYTTLDRSDRAVDVCLSYLRQLGVEWSPHPTDEEARREYQYTWSLLEGREVEELVDLPLMSDPESVATLDVLTKVLSPALFTDANLLAVVTCRMANLSLEHGNTDASCFGYVWLGNIAGPRFGNYDAGFRFGRLGYELVDRRGLERFQARTYMCFGSLIMPWTKHVRTGRDLVRRAFASANTIGDLTTATYCCNLLITNLLAAGDPLPDVQREAEQGLEFAQKARFGLVTDIITTQRALVRTLRGLTATFGCFTDAGFDELRFERRLASDQGIPIAACWYWIRKLQARYFAGDYASAVEASLNAQGLLWTSPSFFESAEAHFYGALSHAAACDAAFPVQYGQHIEALTAHHKQLVEWAENCPQNFNNRVLLVGAEIARVEGRELDAERLYEAAIRSARENDFVHNEALANELAARFYAARGFETISRTYLRNARYGYLRWGADAKVRQLDELYPQIGPEVSTSDGTATIQTRVEHLDLATVIKVSEAVSGEIVLEKLIDTLMRAAIEHAGAERGLLILPRRDDYRIEAEATTSSDRVNVVLRQASVTAAALPGSVFQYVLRTRESVLLQDASGQNIFATDEYIREHHPRSVFCLPLLKQTRLLGVLYLENRLTPHAFTPARMAVLKLLASGAAMSMENTRLYSDLQEREARISALKDQLFRENLALRDEVDRVSMFEEIVGSSRTLKAALSRIAKVAPTDSTVFISGETGTGKELIARAVHKRSRRSGRAFVSVNCAALAPTLISSELFGHEKGAFTGALQRRLGRFEMAEGGTIFLDEVGELPLDTQAALLRVLQEREFERVGGAHTVRVDVRVITATNRDLSAAVANGSFRQDLFYRLNVFPIEVPPLRQRLDDILVLVEYFVKRYATRAGKRFDSIDKKTLELLQQYNWPGNIRELQNVIERSVIVSSGEVFAVDPAWLSTQPVQLRPRVSAPARLLGETRGEREIIEAALAECRGRVAGSLGAAAKLGVPPSTLDHRIRALGISKAQFKFR